MKIHADHALLPSGWARDCMVEIASDGRISRIGDGPDRAPARRVGVLLPAPANLHSHAFQRALAGLTERRGEGARDSFWTWRELMYRFLEHLTPDDMEAIAALVQMEMLEAGYASVGEFHYVHNAPGGGTYDNPAETSLRIMAATIETGIGLTHLPVLYERGGVDGRPLEGGQLRFRNSLDGFDGLIGICGEMLSSLPADARLGVAPHSLRAVSRQDLAAVCGLLDGGPVHIHIAEQTAEVEAVEAAYGARPVAWLLENMPVDERWCLIHATHMSDNETRAMAESGAVTGLCPITESNLGDGIFNGRTFLESGGAFGIGSDSNVRISLAEELRTLEYSQRLGERARAVLAESGKSVGRTLLERVAKGGAQALARDSGEIAEGKLADLVALDATDLALDGLSGDAIVDAFIFAADDSLITDVWSAGRHMVQGGRHIRREAIEGRARVVLKRLRESL
ncbi:formimidoylglutamate deiminase [Stappia sp. GBMRC 2046]|uniref:Formimidoylglutamate deiminase n=1 Tax=Stappia sediminis TaxID=2692190 RepID=A0A7X3LUU2_9HYPH|nr:formimidoylglutamate deiminase [Stappia sediminis]MXN65463.1 formimidoylglutamate deiminase [Stappia sediminis]